MIDSIIFYVRDCCSGCNFSWPQKNKLLPTISTDARRTERSKNRPDISRKRGNAQKIWTPYTQMECNSEGEWGLEDTVSWKTWNHIPKRTVRKSAKSTDWKNCCSFRRKYVLFDFCREATPITEGKYCIFYIIVFKHCKSFKKTHKNVSKLNANTSIRGTLHWQLWHIISTPSI